MPIVGIARNIAPEKLRRIMPVYAAAGLCNIEITMNSPGAAEAIRELAARYGGEMNVGAGTVCTMDELRAALDAGAGFIVSPIVNEEVIGECVRSGVAVFPGAFTPTEIYRAWELGATMVKVFPCSVLGPGYIRDVKAPLGHIELLPTGGIDHRNIAAYREAGASGFGIGSPLLRKELIEAGDWDALGEHFTLFTKAFTK